MKLFKHVTAPDAGKPASRELAGRAPTHSHRAHLADLGCFELVSWVILFECQKCPLKQWEGWLNNRLEGI